MLAAAAGPDLRIMAGGGVRSANIAALVVAAGAHEYHTSAIVANDGQYYSDENEIRTIVGYLNA
jgi:copper homeostasis protein CutC